MQISMWRSLKSFALLLLVLIQLSWGFYGHRKINRMAVFTLPPEMVGFYKRNIEFLSAHAVDADKRRYISEEEAPRHYIDIDHYAAEGEDPFERMPQRWNEAVEKFSEDTLKKYGIVPWHILLTQERLKEAFAKKDPLRILTLSADLGHYVADAHVPLHTTENYNGQLSGQKGIHGLWESRIPELTASSFDFLVRRASYLNKAQESVWKAIKESHQYVPLVLKLEKETNDELSPDEKYVIAARGKTMNKQYSELYAKTYNTKMGDMVEERMRKAVKMIGDFWFTAWVDAGQPDLDQLTPDRKKLEQIEKNSVSDSSKTGIRSRGRKHE